MKAKKHTPKKSNAWEKKQADNDHKWMILKICVISISLVIAVLWGFALRNQFISADWNKTPEFELIKNTQEQWKANEEAITNDQVAHEAAYDAVKIKLSKIITEVNTSTEQIINNEISTSTSSTEESADMLIQPDKKNSQINEN